MIGNWEHLGGIQFKKRTPLDAPWLLFCEELREASHLMIRATGNWGAAPGGDVAFGPDGGLPVEGAELILKDTPAGALIAKVGGSTAGWGCPPPPLDPAAAATSLAPPKARGDVEPEAGVAFPVGSFVIFAVPPKCQGPLFVGVNLRRRPFEWIDLEVDVYGGNPSVV